MAEAVFVNKARKARPEQGIEIGDSYYWWKFRFGPTHFSKIQPRPSSLTQSEFLSGYYSIQEQLEDSLKIESTSDDYQPLCENLMQQMEDLRDLSEDRLDDMPVSLRQGDTGRQLQDRALGMDDWRDVVEALPGTVGKGRDIGEWIQEQVQEIIDNDPQLD